MKPAAPAVPFEEPIMRRRTALSALCALALAGTLAGCAAINSVAVDVSSQGEWPADRKPGSYAIERLPSQQANAAEQERIEAAALPALEGAGFTQAPIEQADYLIQVGARVFEVPGGYGYYASPFYWRNDYVGIEQWSRHVHDGMYVYLPQLHQQHESSAKLWDINLREQQFVEAFSDKCILG